MTTTHSTTKTPPGASLLHAIPALWAWIVLSLMGFVEIDDLRASAFNNRPGLVTHAAWDASALLA